MSYQDFYLTFEDEAAAQAVLYTAAEGEEPQANYRNIDVIGLIYKHSDDPEAEPVSIPGWHVNVRVMDDEAAEPLAQYAVNPRTPIRIWG